MKCSICENNCLISEGTFGKCGLYLNQRGKIIERYPDRFLIISPITIETMPMLHFQPQGKFLQLSTVGCNFDCPGCISTVIVKEMGYDAACLQKREPDEIIREAMEKECLGISFLMNDPLASLPTFIKVAKKAKENGLFVGCSSNTFFTENSLAEILPYLDFINVGIKGFSEQSYRKCGARSEKPVWRNIEILHRAGIHVEISCMYRKNEEDDLLSLARKISHVSPDIPFQVMRFIPMENADPALEVTIEEAEKMCLTLRKSLRYVYLFNSPGTDWLTTYCSNCGEWILRRDFYGPMGARIKSSQIKANGKAVCAVCGTAVPFKADKITSQTGSFREPNFQGGYPFTRALEILESIVIAMGIRNQGIIREVWNEYIDQKMLQKLHHDIQAPEAFIALIRSIGANIGCPEKASMLADYIEPILRTIKEKCLSAKKKPRVYYAMGKPLFCINGERMENQLVETAGGIAVNKGLNTSGRPGETVLVHHLNEFNPEIIFISAFISSPVDDFYKECLRAGIQVDAVKNRRIYTHPAPGWDFGSPRWILGLMYISNMLHPDIFQFDVLREADKFYKKFYGVPFVPANINRSFSKPSSAWKLEQPGNTIDQLQKK